MLHRNHFSAERMASPKSFFPKLRVLLMMILNWTKKDCMERSAGFASCVSGAADAELSTEVLARALPRAADFSVEPASVRSLTRVWPYRPSQSCTSRTTSIRELALLSVTNSIQMAPVCTREEDVETNEVAEGADSKRNEMVYQNQICGLFDGGMSSKEGNVRIVILPALMNPQYDLKCYVGDSYVEFVRMWLFFLLL